MRCRRTEPPVADGAARVICVGALLEAERFSEDANEALLAYVSVEHVRLLKTIRMKVLEVPAACMPWPGWRTLQATLSRSRQARSGAGQTSADTWTLRTHTYTLAPCASRLTPLTPCASRLTPRTSHLAPGA